LNSAGDIAKVTATGGFHILWGLVISTVISSVGVIFVARLLGSDLYGLYGIVLAAPNLIMIFRDWGVNSAMIKFTAQYRAEDRAAEVRSILLSGLIFELSFGLVLTIVSFMLSGFLASTVFNRPSITPLIQIASLSILTNSLVTVAAAAFTGMEKMAFNSIMILCQSTIKTLLIIVLIILGLSISGAVIGFLIGSLIAGLVGLLFMRGIYNKLPKPPTFNMEVKAYLREMLKYGVPLSSSAILSGFLTLFYAFLLPIHYVTENSTIGNYGIAQNFVLLIGFFATPILTVLFPAFSKLDFRKDKEKLQNVYQFSIKYSSLLVIPVTVLVIVLSQPAINVLFGDAYAAASVFLSLLSLIYLYTSLGYLSNENLISSQGETKLILKLTIITAAIGFSMGTILILKFGVLGLIVTSLTAGLPSLLLSLLWLKRHYNLTVDWSSSAKILLSSVIAGASTYAIITQNSFASWVQLILGLVVFTVILVPVMILTKGILRSDINNLKLMLSGLGLHSSIIGKMLAFIEKIMRIIG
jgi:O-antigen/teichoic acid export membrane protein